MKLLETDGVYHAVTHHNHDVAHTRCGLAVLLFLSETEELPPPLPAVSCLGCVAATKEEEETCP